jgi:parvulin-like peptidyl-prolyl isomerase
VNPRRLGIRYILICAAAIFSGCSRERNYVAEVAGHEIPAEAFKERYSMYLENTRSRDNIVLRQRILNNMINEELIFDDVKRHGLDNDAVAKERFEEFRQQAMLDAYAKRISLDTMSVSEQELMREFRKYNSKVSARYLYAKTQKQAWDLKRQLEQGETFERLAKDLFKDPGLANNGGYLGTFGWGEMEAALEDAAFSIPVGTVSDPVRLRIGYAIVKVENRVEQPLASELDYANAREKLGKAVEDKKVIRLVMNAAEEIGKDLAPVFNEEAVELVFKNWSYAMNEPQHPASFEHPSALPENSSSMTLVSFHGKSWTVGEFLGRLEKTTAKQRKRVKSSADVKDVAIGLATREILLDRARSAGLENDPGVQLQARKAKDAYLLKRWAGSVQDTVGQRGWDEKLMRRIYEENKIQYAYPPEFNVAEILVRTKTEAEAMLRQLKKGADFAALARKNSVRLWAAKRGGELGFGTKAKYGVLGEKFFAARLGEVVGPEWVDPYFGLFKILERQEGRPMTFKEAKDQISESLTFSTKQEVFKKAVENLRASLSLNINNENLANVVLR